MEPDITQEAEAFFHFSKEFWAVLQIALPLLVLVLARNWFLNFVCFLIIKINTSYQFQNNFEMDGKDCQVLAITAQNVFVVEIKTGKEIQIRCKDFMSKDIWHYPPSRYEVWTDKQRESHRKKLKKGK